MILCGKRHRHYEEKYSKLPECFDLKITFLQTGLCSAQDDMPSTDAFEWHSDDIPESELNNLSDNDMQSFVEIDNLTEESPKVITLIAKRDMLVGEVVIIGSAVSFSVDFIDLMGRTTRTHGVSNMH